MINKFGGSKKNVFIGWCVFYRNRPASFHSTKALALACMPENECSNTKWIVKKVRCVMEVT